MVSGGSDNPGGLKKGARPGHAASDQNPPPAPLIPGAGQPRRRGTGRRGTMTPKLIAWPGTSTSIRPTRNRA
jgi:hypothetical protein